MPVSCQPLQTCCFMKLIKDFETFPSLALLPLRLRYELIQNLPAVDVCQLEQSSFVEGLDMEKVWETHCNQRILRKWRLPTRITAATGGNKDVYFSGVCKILLDHDDYRYLYDRSTCVSYRTRILELLFCCFGIGDWFEHQPNKLLVPSRYDSYFAKPAVFSDPQLLALVLQNSCYYYPKSLHCNVRFPSQYWERSENYSLLVDYLKEVCNLHLSYSYLYPLDPAFPYLKFILHILSKRLLSSLVLAGMSDELLENTLLALRPKLIGDHGSHSQLQIFEVRNYTKYCNISDVIASVISRVLVANQTSLHTIMLTGSIPHHLCSCLSSFFKQPHLRLIRLTSATLRLRSLQEILYAFLTTPHSSGSEGVRLHIRDNFFQSTAQDMSGFNHRLLCLRPPKNNHCKSLVLIFSHVELPHPLITWLQERVVLRLKKLELSLEIAHCFLNHQRMEVEEFFIASGWLMGSDRCETARRKALKYLETPGCFDNVLGNKYLKRFSIQVQLTSEIVLNLVRGLHKQAEVGNLEELDLFYNPLDDMAEISEAIFSLPQIEKLTLAIMITRSHDFHESDLAMLKRSWRKKAGGKKLKKLIVYGALVKFPVVPEQTLQGIITRELVLTLHYWRS